MSYIPVNVITKIPFLRRSELFKTVKPYTTDFSTETFPRSNMEVDEDEDILVMDIRGFQSRFTYERNGFDILPFETSLPYEDFSNRQRVEEVYCRELGAFLLDHFQASAVQIFEMQVRRRHPSFPENLLDRSIGYQPAIRPHIDSSFENIQRKISILNGELAEDLLKKKWVYLNTWKPLRGPLRDWPLAICDAATITPESDLTLTDNLVKGENEENACIHFNKAQRWYYLGDHSDTELLVFRQVDSDRKTGVPHASFPLPPRENEVPSLRESVEVRVVLYF